MELGSMGIHYAFGHRARSTTVRAIVYVTRNSRMRIESPLKNPDSMGIHYALFRPILNPHWRLLFCSGAIRRCLLDP